MDEFLRYLVSGTVAYLLWQLGAYVYRWVSCSPKKKRVAYLQKCAKMGICGVCARSSICISTSLEVVGCDAVRLPVYSCYGCGMKVVMPEDEARRRVQDAIADKIAEEKP